MSYWDSSALLPVFVTQAGSTEVRDLVADEREPATSWHTLIEFSSGLARLVREEVLLEDEAAQVRASLQDLLEGGIEVEMTEALRTLACSLLQRHSLRAGDAIHLAAALTWAREQPEAMAFVCLDTRLREAALREGFTVLPAGLAP